MVLHLIIGNFLTTVKKNGILEIDYKIQKIRPFEKVDDKDFIDVIVARRDRGGARGGASLTAGQPTQSSELLSTLMNPLVANYNNIQTNEQTSSHNNNNKHYSELTSVTRRVSADYSKTSKQRTIWDQSCPFAIKRLFASRGDKQHVFCWRGQVQSSLNRGNDLFESISEVL